MPFMRILLTGATGFVGCHLAEALAGTTDVLTGVGRNPAWPTGWQHLAARVPLHGCDLGDSVALEAVLRAVQPEQVYHLAGYPHVGLSFKEEDAAWAGNLTATLHLYRTAVRCGLKPRILYV